MTSSANDFDFWIGTWQGTWDGASGAGSAVNVVEKAYGGHVVLERFQADAPEELAGSSVSVYDTAEGCWKQTWVDNTGSYLDFRGGRRGADLVLDRETEADGVPLAQRMVWVGVETAGKRFEWLWQRSRDFEHWTTVWAIAYVRVEA